MVDLKNVRQKMSAAARRAGRDPKSVRLIAVSKGRPIEKIREAAAKGQKDFGENYAQELAEKAAALQAAALKMESGGEKISWHFLGHLQKNKLAKVLGGIDWLHSLDSFSLAEAIEKRAAKKLNCLLEIKFSDEISKTGLPPEAALQLIPKLNAFEKIELKGLMTMAPLSAGPNEARLVFRKLFELLKTINQRYLYKRPLTELSMGMSADFETAIEEGATMVRIGEALFGKREVP